MRPTSKTLRFFCILAVIAAIGSGVSSAESAPAKSQAQAGFAAMYNQARLSTVLISSADLGKLQPGEGFGLGAGVVIPGSKRPYYVLTAYHVVDKTPAIYAKFDDQNGYQEMVLVGWDASFDVALLEFKDKNFRPSAIATLGDSDTLRVEQNGTFYVMGHPIGLEFMWSEGKLMREKAYHAIHRLTGFLPLQTNCNPGNSGGPVLTGGKVIGIVDAITISPSPICLVIPVNVARTLLPQLEAGGEIKHGRLGIELANTWDLKPHEKSGIPGEGAQTKGVLAKGVVPNSSASAADIRPGDLLLYFLGKNGARIPIREAREFIEQLNLNFFAGEEVLIAFRRGSDTLVKRLRLREDIAPAKKK